VSAHPPSSHLQTSSWRRAPAQPPTVNTDNRKRRNVVKRWFHRFKQARNAASRYDKAATYQPTVTIAALPQWK
jgi:transposase